MKYIDADKLIDKILQLQKEYAQTEVKEDDKTMRVLLGGQCFTLIEVVKIIYSLQQEQPKQQNGKFVFPKFLYARTKDNKTVDVSYAPQDMTAVEYIRNNFVEQEQPEVDLENEIEEHSEMMPMSEFTHESEAEEFVKWAKQEFRHFYERGVKAGKEESK
jgi:hypothetical protein